MADLTSTTTQAAGLLIPLPGLGPSRIWTAETSLTQSGPRPGLPQPQRRTRGVLTSHGSQAANTGLRVQTIAGGSAGTSQAAYVWRYATDGTDEWRGWDPPSVLRDWRGVTVLDGTLSPARAAQDPHAVTLADGSVVVAFQLQRDNVVAEHAIVVQVMDPATGTFGSRITVEALGAEFGAGRRASPCLVPLSDDELACFYMVQLTDGRVQVRMSLSLDGGATWAIASRYCLPEALEYAAEGSGTAGWSDFHRLRVAHLDGAMMLVLGARVADTTDDADGADDAARDKLMQFGSRDLGTSFQAVYTPPSQAYGYTGRYHDLVVAHGAIWAFWVSTFDTAGATSGRIHVSKIGSALLGIGRHTVREVPDDDAVAAGTLASTAGTGASTIYRITDGDLAACVSDTGTLYVAHRSADAGHTNAWLVLQSDDQGQTWEYLGQSATTSTAGTPFQSGDAATYLVGGAMCWQQRRVLLFSSWVASPGNEDNSIGVAVLGGPTTICLPDYGGVRMATSRVGWDRTGLPIELPSDTGWSASGAGTSVLVDGVLRNTTVAQQRFHDIVFTSTVDEGWIGQFAVLASSGGAVGADACAVRVRLADGVDDYDLSVRVGAAAVRLRDNNAGGGAGADLSDLTVVTTAGVVLLIAVVAGRCFVAVRPLSLLPDAAWSDSAVDTLVSDTGSPAAGNLVSFGALASSTSVQDWYQWSYAYSTSTGAQLAATSSGPVNPDDLLGHRYSVTPSYVDGGTSIALLDGPTLPGDAWHIDVEYDAAFDRVFPAVEASPRRGWESTTNAAEVTVALQLDDVLTALSALGSDTWGMGLIGTNLRLAYLEGWDGAAWQQVLELDGATGMTSLSATRLGSSLVPASSAIYKPYLHFAGCAGWTADLGGVVARRVRWNTEGRWDSAYVGPKPTLFLEDVDSGDPSVAVSVRLWPTSMVGTANLLGATYSAWQLRIPAQNTVSGKLEIGTLVIGPVIVLGRRYAWGRVVSTESATKLEVSDDWISTAVTLATPRRIVELNWQEGIALAKLSGAPADPDYLALSTSSGAQPIASAQGTPYTLEGLLRLLDGPATPLVYLPDLQVNPAGDTQVHNARDSHVYARQTGPVRIEAMQGDERRNEVVRVATIALREEV